MASAALEVSAFSVSGGLEAGSAARREVRALDGAVPASVRDDILLLVTELVTNAVRHGGVGPDKTLDVALQRWPRRVRVEVAEPVACFLLAPTRFGREVSGGLGLVLVDRIADRWGVDRKSSGTRVWFEIPLAA
jgi:anti-sigma regulatory factor (Ser/Thr protein kinase)